MIPESTSRVPPDAFCLCGSTSERESGTNLSVLLGSGWEFSRAGRYDAAGNNPGEPPNQRGSDAIYPVANLGFDLVVVPEPVSLSVFCWGAGLCGLMRKWSK
jgi:hypothetical protein